MGFKFNHVHLKAHDPAATVKFYVENFGATIKAERPGWGFLLDLDGVQLNVTPLVATQKHEQFYGIEHIGMDTDDYAGQLAKLKANNVKILEELVTPDKRRICFLQAPDGAHFEVIEKTAAS
jgi:catechol 2,3-dioxygenase-like lactoylglutathione lyase family enzyme